MVSHLFPEKITSSSGSRWHVAGCDVCMNLVLQSHVTSLLSHTYPLGQAAHVAIVPVTDQYSSAEPHVYTYWVPFKRKYVNFMGTNALKVPPAIASKALV